MSSGWSDESPHDEHEYVAGSSIHKTRRFKTHEPGHRGMTVLMTFRNVGSGNNSDNGNNCSDLV